ncbi:ankyrin 2,3/unc44, partial [Thraustotheca clavata]
CDLSVLTMAALYGYDQIVRLIFKYTDYKQLDDYNTAPMVQAVENNRTRIVKTLLEFIGNQIHLDNLRNCDDKLMLHVAAENGFNEILELLLDAGASPNTTTEDGETALHYAARGGNARAIELLVRAQANVNAQQFTGLTPLHYAVEHCDDVEKAKAVVTQLFMAEAALDILDNDGINAASTAKTTELRSLLNKEAKFRADCPVHYMVRNGNLEKLTRWFSDLNAHVMLAPHTWEGQYRQGATWYHVQLTVNVVPVPHEGLYRFFGSDTDGIGPFTIKGSWSGTTIEATKLYEEQNIEYNGEIDLLTGVWSGDWTGGTSSDVFNFQIQLEVCPQCKQNKVPNRDEACLSCLPAEYNSDVNEDTVEEQRLRLEQIQESITKEILARDENGRTALMCAAQEGRAGILKVLLHFCKAKALDDTDNDGKTALDYALSRKLVCKHNVDHNNNEETLDCIEMLSSYSKTSVDPTHIPTLLNFKREQGRCTGDCVATLEEVNLAELAQQYEWDRLGAKLMQTVPEHILNKLDTTGKSVLHHVVSVGKSDILTLLLDQKNININLTTEDGQYPLMLAASANRVKCVRLLLNAGADPLNLISPDHFDYMNFRKAPLGLLSDSKALYLLESKNNLKQKYLPYYIARVPNCEQASVHVQAKQSALHVAILAELSVDILQKIIDQSIYDVNSQDKHDETPLMVATKKGLVDHVKVLLKNGADVDCVNNRHESALMMAAVGGYVNIVSILLENLADVDIRDGLDRTVLDLLDDYVKDHLMKLNKQEMMKAPHVQIQIIILSEIRQRQTSAEYRAKLAKSLSDVNVENAFRHNGFSKAINCSPELGVTFLNDCVTLDRHDVHFSNLDLVYGKRVSSSALYALLNMKTDDPELIFESKTKCFEHVVMQRVLEIKWELFGQRKFFEMLLVNMLLLVTMTISAITFSGLETKTKEVFTPTSFKLVIAILSMALTIVGYIALQGLRPRLLWRLSRFHYDRSIEFDADMEIPNLEYHKTKVKRYLKFTVVIGTVVLTFALIGLLQVTSLISSFSIINNLVLAGCALYFLLTEYQEARAGLASYLE